jgi:hypothetical protein
VLSAFNTMVNLQKDGKVVFGQDSDSKTLLTGLYVSRIPLNVGAGTAASSEDPRSTIDREALDGKASIYSYLAKGSDPLAQPLELRPEPPLLVVVSGEYDGAGGKGAQPLTALKSAVVALNIPGVNEQAIRPYFRENFAKRSEIPLVYAHPTWTAERKTAAAAPLPEVSYTNFNLVLRWEDKEDLDNEPSEGGAVPAGGAKAGAPVKK